VPLPSSFVVKNGSKARLITSGGMPVPLSLTVPKHPDLPDITVRICIVGVREDVARLDRQLSAVRHGVTCIHRSIQNAAFHLDLVDHDLPESPGQDRLNHDLLAKGTPKQVRHPCHELV
jgi:hypothetical protein